MLDKTTYIKAPSEIIGRKVSIRNILVLTLFFLIIIFMLVWKPRIHFLDFGGSCEVSGFSELGKPIRGRRCFCLGAVTRKPATGWVEGPSNYTCGGMGISF